MAQDAGNIPKAALAWNIETITGRKDFQATIGEMETAMRSPEFAAVANRNPALAKAVAATRDGTTAAEGEAFDAAVRSTPGALEAFEAALETVAGQRWIINHFAPAADNHADPATGLLKAQ